MFNRIEGSQISAARLMEEPLYIEGMPINYYNSSQVGLYGDVAGNNPTITSTGEILPSNILPTSGLRLVTEKVIPTLAKAAQILLGDAPAEPIIRYLNPQTGEFTSDAPIANDHDEAIREPKASQYDEINEKLKSENGLGRHWYNLSDKNLPSSSSDLLEGTAYALRINGGQAPLTEVARLAKQSEEAILSLQSLKGSIQVFPSENGPIVACRPLQAFMAEKGLLKTPEISAVEIHTSIAAD